MYLGQKLWARIPNHFKSASLKTFKDYIRKRDLSILIDVGSGMGENVICVQLNYY